MGTIFYNLSVYLCDKMNTSYPRVQMDNIKIRYGLELFLDNIIKTTIYLIVAALLHCFTEVVLLIAIFGGLRMLAGGMHMNTSLGCFLASGSIFIGGTMISIHIQTNSLIFLAVMCLSLILLHIYAPSGTIENPVNPENCKARKFKALLFVSIAVLVGICLKGVYQNLIMIGVSFEVLTILPFANRKYKEIRNG